MCHLQESISVCTLCSAVTKMTLQDSAQFPIHFPWPLFQIAASLDFWLHVALAYNAANSPQGNFQFLLWCQLSNSFVFLYFSPRDGKSDWFSSSPRARSCSNLLPWNQMFISGLVIYENKALFVHGLKHNSQDSRSGGQGNFSFNGAMGKQEIFIIFRMIFG